MADYGPREKKQRSSASLPPLSATGPQSLRSLSLCLAALDEVSPLMGTARGTNDRRPPRREAKRVGTGSFCLSVIRRRLKARPMPDRCANDSRGVFHTSPVAK